jgi:DNA-binding response OmpR family regulator
MPTLLVIDDDKEYRRFLEEYLTRLGFIAFGVDSGDQGLEFSKNIHPDLILLDWCLKKGFSGEETLRLIKTRPATKDVPVIVISGIKESAEDEQSARRAGASLFFSKNEISDTIPNRKVFQRRLQALILGKLPDTGLSRQAVKSKRLAPVLRTAGRILTIDDDPEIRDMISFVLRDKGYTISTADKGAQGLAKAQQESPDLIILDLTMPDMDGLEVLTQLKTSPRTRPIPVLILTGRASTQAQLLAAEYGADHFFTKPILDLEEFHNWIAAFLRRRSTTNPVDPTVIRVGDQLVIDTEAHTLNIEDRVITKISNISFRLICEFARKPGEILSYDYLVHRVWDGRVREHNVNTAVSRLKAVLGKIADDWFVCVPGVGFRMLPVSPERVKTDVI